MRVEVPPWQSLPKVSASVSISPAEAMELRNALNVVVARGSSAWNVNVAYAEVAASVTLTLRLDVPQNKLSAV